MSATQSQMQTRVLRRLDATGSSRWDTTAGSTGEIDRTVGFVHWREWKRILNANRHFRLNNVVAATTLTTTGSGTLSFSSFDTGTGDSKKFAYRIITFMREGHNYSQGSIEEYPEGGESAAQSRIWMQQGQTFLFLPVEASITLAVANNDNLWVNWVPQRADVLATAGVAIDFPEGYEEIIEYEAAALLAAKGGAETDETSYFKVMAEEMRADMLQDVSRMAAKPLYMRYSDMALEWGG